MSFSSDIVMTEKDIRVCLAPLSLFEEDGTLAR